MSTEIAGVDEPGGSNDVDLGIPASDLDFVGDLNGPKRKLAWAEVATRSGVKLTWEATR